MWEPAFSRSVSGHASIAGQAQQQIHTAGLSERSLYSLLQAALQQKEQELAGVQRSVTDLQTALQATRAEVEAADRKRKKVRAECNERLEQAQALVAQVWPAPSMLNPHLELSKHDSLFICKAGEAKWHI